MPAYPATLPPPIVDDYELQPEDPIARTDMEAGPARTRRRYTAFPTQIPISWKFNRTEFALFEAWHKLTILDGASWFDMTLANGLELSTYSTRFVRIWKSKLKRGLNWEVKAILEVRSRPTLTQEELDVATAYGLADIAAATPTLHAWLHTTMPAANYW